MLMSVYVCVHLTERCVGMHKEMSFFLPWFLSLCLCFFFYHSLCFIDSEDEGDHESDNYDSTYIEKHSFGLFFILVTVC